MNQIVLAGFSDELCKMAHDKKPVEVGMNKDTLRRALAVAGMAALGTGVGYGTARAAKILLHRRLPSPRRSIVSKGLAYGLPALTGVASGYLANEMYKKRRELMEDAQRQHEEKQSAKDRGS
jgi:hypothetical protein